MAEVVHILKDGTRLEDITGHVVRISDAEAVYGLMDYVNRRLKNETDNSGDN